MNNIWQPLCDKSITTQYDILYCRLSRDDGLDERESDSISHQRDILADYAAKNGFNHPICVVDDGFSGTNFQRPGWQLVLQEIENGNVRSIICKNKDRFSRDYLRTRLYMEMFRDKAIRFIAIGDGYDNINEDDDFTPFRDIISEFYECVQVGATIFYVTISLQASKPTYSRAETYTPAPFSPNTPHQTISISFSS